MTKETIEDKLLGFWLISYPVLFALAYSQAALFKNNQNTKLLPGLSMAGYKDVASDWMAHVTDTFPLFSHLLKWQYEFLGLYLGVHGAFFLLVGLYAATSLWLARKVVGGDGNSKRYLFVFSMLWMFLHWYKVRDNWQAIIPDGLGNQYIIRTYYQPCVYGVLLITATAAYVSRRLVPAAFLLVLASLIHPTYLISSSLIAFTIVLLPANQAMEISWKKRIIFLVIFLSVVGGYSIWMLNLVGSGDPMIKKEAHRLLAETRIPEHALVTAWDVQKSVLFFAVGLVSAWFARKQLIGQLLLVLLLIVGATLAWTSLDFNATVAVAAPWRISAYLAPLSWIVIIAFAASWLNRLISGERIMPFKFFMTVTMVGAGIASVWGGFGLYQDYQRKETEDFYSVCRFIETVHQPGSQYLVPVLEENFGMEAGVPVYVTWKTHPTKDTEFLEWHGRIKKAQAVYEGEVPASDILKYLKSLAVTHVIWPASKSEFPYAGAGRQLYVDDAFSLWEMSQGH